MKSKVHVLQHVSFEGPDAIAVWCREHNLAVTTTKFFEPDYSLPKLDNLDALMIMGGPMGVNDEDKFAWLRDEKLLIEQAIGHGKKVFGVCLGAQLIASLLGARVYQNRLREIGWFKVSKTEQASKSAFTCSFPESFDVFQWHGDTYDLPSGCDHLFRADACEQQGFSMGSNVIGLQFHIEVTPNSILGFLDNNARDLEPPGPYVQSAEQIIANLSKTHSVNSLLQKLLDEFVQVEVVESRVHTV
jgi:GMP synthase-like glutamine amidotransferase